MILACVLVPELEPLGLRPRRISISARTPPSWRPLDGHRLLRARSDGADLLRRAHLVRRRHHRHDVVSFVIGVTWGGVAGYFGKRVDSHHDAPRRRPLHLPVPDPGDLAAGVLRERRRRPDALFKWSIRPLRRTTPADPSWFPIFQICFVFAALGGISWLTMARIVRGQVSRCASSRSSRRRVRSASAHGAHHLPAPAAERARADHRLHDADHPADHAHRGVSELPRAGDAGAAGQLGRPVASTAPRRWTSIPWTLVFPALMLALTLFCFNFLGDGLRDALDPRIRKD